MILVMGASGNQGRILLPKLRDAGLKVRAFRATAGGDRELRDLGADEVVIGNAIDRAILRKAMDGIDTVYHVGPAMHPFELEIGLAMVSVAAEADIGHFIYSSVLHAIASKLIQHKLKRDVEERLLESWLDFTILHPGDYMMPQLFRPAFERGVFEWLFDAESPQSMVDLHDFADVVVKIVRERQAHFGATYELCAPGVHTGNDIARTVSDVIGKPVEVRVPSPDDWSAMIMAGGNGPGVRYQSNVVQACSLWYGKYRFLGNPNVLTWLLGRTPTTLKECVEREWRNFQAA